MEATNVVIRNGAKRSYFPFLRDGTKELTKLTFYAKERGDYFSPRGSRTKQTCPSPKKRKYRFFLNRASTSESLSLFFLCFFFLFLFFSFPFFFFCPFSNEQREDAYFSLPGKTLGNFPFLTPAGERSSSFSLSRPVDWSVSSERTKEIARPISLPWNVALPPEFTSVVQTLTNARSNWNEISRKK